MKELNLKAYCKVNLSLDVLSRRPDGYHEVRMVMQSIDVADEITLVRRDDSEGIRMEVTNMPSLECDERNLAWKAAALLLGDHRRKTTALQTAGPEEGEPALPGLTIRLTKNVPVAAGLGGGSSDAAAVLRGVNELFDLGYSLQELMVLGKRIGADVPFCVMGGTALAEGIGEKLTALPAFPSCPILLAKPKISVSTAYVYQHLDLTNIPERPNNEEMLEALSAGNLTGVARSMGNVLESSAIPNWPVIGEIRAAMKEAGAISAMMSGSGPSVYGLFSCENCAAAAKEKLAELFDLEYLGIVHPVTAETVQKSRS